MSRKTVWITLFVLLVAGAGVGLALYGPTLVAPRNLAEAYLGALFEADAAKARALQHPSWDYGEVVDSVLEAAAKDVHEVAGAFEGLDSWKVVRKVGADQPAVLNCTLRFKGGRGKGRLHILDDRVVGYHVVVDGMPEKWKIVPADKTWYHEAGRALLEAYATGDGARAHAMMAHDFKAKVSESELIVDAAEARERMGRIQSVEFVTETEAPLHVLVEMVFKVVGEKKTSYTKVRFQNGFGHVAIVGMMPSTEAEARGGS